MAITVTRQRDITICVSDECQNCDLMKLKPYKYDILPYCTLFKTFLPFRECEDDIWIVKPCYECVECTNGNNVYYFESGKFKEKE